MLWLVGPHLRCTVHTAGAPRIAATHEYRSVGDDCDRLGFAPLRRGAPPFCGTQGTLARPDPIQACALCLLSLVPHRMGLLAEDAALLVVTAYLSVCGSL